MTEVKVGVKVGDRVRKARPPNSGWDTFAWDHCAPHFGTVQSVDRSGRITVDWDQTQWNGAWTGKGLYPSQLIVIDALQEIASIELRK